ncbi:glycoside-pentoside-hexuronide (GPH):cation symporter [Streptomyces sp. Edi2]|uniref:glycoside-pentoside-hexuronide (GPH):cation symporter n=1 Tax=Streptomyces sp. Edi2 TaxID=3162528 RepID=UPI0033066C85
MAAARTLASTPMTGPTGERTPKLRTIQYIGYGAGDFANNLAFSMASMFLLLYYTDVVGISATTAGTLFLVVRAWDGIGDVIAGRIVDRTSTRWGKYRPYLLFASLPLMLLLVALFSVPGGLSEGGALVYAYISYALFSFAYGLVNIPYGSLSTAMTQDPDERSKLSSARVLATNLVILLLAVVVSRQIATADDLQQSLTIITLGLVGIGMALYVFTFSTAKEQVQRDVEKVSLRQAWDTVKQNKPLLRLGLSSVLFLCGMFALETTAIYYARYVLDDAGLYVVLVAVQVVGMLLATLVIPTTVTKIGKRTSYIAGGTITVLGGIITAVAPGSVPAIAIVGFGIMGIGIGAINTLIWALVADTVEYGEWKTGVRAEGATYSVLSLSRKFGQAVGAAAAAYIIGLGGYESGAATQSDGALTAIRIATGAVPALVILPAIAVMVTYPLTEKKFRQIVADIAQRHAEPGPDESRAPRV